MSDTGTEPTRHGPATGAELMFVFILPALMIVGSIAAMAHTGYWWLMGVAFAGALIATGLVALTIFHYTDDGPEATPAGSSKQTMNKPTTPKRPARRHRHHRLALHH